MTSNVFKHGASAGLALAIVLGAGSIMGSRVRADNRENHRGDRTQASSSDRNQGANRGGSQSRVQSENRTQVFNRGAAPVAGTRATVPQTSQQDRWGRVGTIPGGANRPVAGAPVPQPVPQADPRWRGTVQGNRDGDGRVWDREHNRWVYRGYGYGTPYYRSGYPSGGYGGYYGGGYGYPGGYGNPGGYGSPGGYGGYGYPGAYGGGGGSSWESKGYRDGVNRGREDARSGRTPNPNNSEHFRNGNPPYRAGFARGYRVGYGQYRGYGRRF